MIRALLDRGVRPDVVVGASGGAVHGAMLAADPTPDVLGRMEEFWREVVDGGVLRANARGALRSSRQRRFEELLRAFLGAGSRFEDLAIPLHACAASIERATARYFDHGALIPAVAASCATPGLFPPYHIDGEHYVDGLVLESALIGRAMSLGAKTLFVLRLNQREPALTVPRRPWQVAEVNFEISRRHHLATELNKRPDGVTVHNLPSGEETLPLVRGHGKQGELAAIRTRIDEGYRAVTSYLEALAEGHVAQGQSAADVSGLGAPRLPRALRSETAAPASAVGAAETSAEVSAFVAGKLDRFFELCDQNRDDAVAETDLLALGGRIAETFGARTGSLVHQRLEHAFADFWLRIRAAAGLDEIAAKTVRREDFRSALVRLTVDGAAYDEHIYPLVSSLTAVADDNGDDSLNPAEVSSLLRALGVAEGDVRMFVLRLDTDNDGAISRNQLDDAFRDFFTAEEPGAVGNALLGGAQG
jgi:predicted acylesterase/phospholipase RssA